MKRIVCAVLLLVCVGCRASYYVPDKFNLQVNIDPENSNRNSTEVDQVRFGLVWDLPQPD